MANVANARGDVQITPHRTHAGAFFLLRLTFRTKEVVLEAQRDKKKVYFAALIDICHLKKRGVRTQITEV